MTIYASPLNIGKTANTEEEFTERNKSKQRCVTEKQYIEEIRELQ